MIDLECIYIPMTMLNPRFSSSRYSWHKAQASQQQWTKQSVQSFPFKPYCCLIFDR